MYRHEVAKLLGWTLQEVEDNLKVWNITSTEEIPLTLVNYWLEVEMVKRKYNL